MGNFVIMAVLGGTRLFWGPLVGAAIRRAAGLRVEPHRELDVVFVGLFFVLVVLFFPRGVMGILAKGGATDATKEGV